MAFVGLLNILCRWLTPLHLPALVPATTTRITGIRTRGQQRKETTRQHEKGEALTAPRYLNINLVYELWKDIDFAFLKVSHPSAAQHLLRLGVMWSLLNMPFCALLLWLSRVWGGAGWGGSEK